MPTLHFNDRSQNRELDRAVSEVESPQIVDTVSNPMTHVANHEILTTPQGADALTINELADPLGAATGASQASCVTPQPMPTIQGTTNTSKRMYVD